MEESSPPSQSDVDQLHPPANHSRPFFYVQPPSQPYFMYQWPMDPFGHYVYPGPMLPYGRPCMPPYQFMQYPGYVVPHAPMQPTDYRRIAPLFPSTAALDLRFRQHFQQMSMHRETMSSEVQTEAGDPVSKLMEGLPACERSGVVKNPNIMTSSTHGVTSLTHEVEKMNCGDNELNVLPGSRVEKTDQDNPVKPAVLCDSAVYDAESSLGRLEECVLSDVLPLGSSSIRDESRSRDRDKRTAFVMHEKSDTSCVSNASHSAEVQDSGAHVSDHNGSDLCEGKTSILIEKVENIPPAAVAVMESLLPITADCELPYQILHLPYDGSTPGLFLQKEVDTLYLDPTSTVFTPKRYTFGSPYTSSYYPPVAPERQSILSPSLDELSSRDEMFSTDVEDDVTSGQACAGGNKLADIGAVSIHSETVPTDDTCSVWARTCACCGANLPDEDVSPAELLDCDCELEEDAEVQSICDVEKVVSRQHLSRHGVSQVKRQEVVEPGGLEDHGRGECIELPHPPAKDDKAKGQRSTQLRSCSEDFQKESLGEVVEEENWSSYTGKQRFRFCKASSGLQEKGRPARRRPSCKTFAQQRTRRSEYDEHDETELFYCHRGRGSTKRRGTRC